MRASIINTSDILGFNLLPLLAREVNIIINNTTKEKIKMNDHIAKILLLFY